MKRLSFPKFTAGLFLLSMLVVHYDAAAAAIQSYQYPNLVGGQGLYNASDSVIILNATNFKTNVYEDTKGWLVEFYNSWCGFCYRFAPIWKELASNIYSWRDIVVVAAIDCADDDNNPICREYDIMQYPMLKYFSVNAHPPSLGIPVEKGDSVDAVRHNLIDRLEKEQEEGRGLTWPNITPYRNVETKNIWKSVPHTVKYFFLIFENVDSHLGAEVILDMHKVTSLQIRKVTSKNELLCVMNKITKFPSLIVLSRTEAQQTLPVRIPTREGVQRTIKDYMKSKGINISDQLSITVHNKHVEHEEKSQSGATKQTDDEDDKLLEDHLYQLDLENALRYSINHEIPLSKLIEGEEMNALRAYLHILSKYFPLRHGNMFLNTVYELVKKKESISGAQFRQQVKSIEQVMTEPVYSGPPQWIGCKGSSEAYRGYPCGLWTMFHMLTVHFALNVVDNKKYGATEVLGAMHGYIKHFFGCADCSKHFVEMADRNRLLDVRTADESILWLWKAHNEVNMRLSGDKTEDPKHKKIQYPSSGHCPTCRYENGTWNIGEVLNYLKKKYSAAEVKYLNLTDKHDKGKDQNKVKYNSVASGSHMSTKRFGWDFTIFDISICVLLYIISATILILVCIKFAVKRTYKRRVYVNLLGKV